MQVEEELASLRLDLLSEAWVEGIYFAEFLEFGEFPPEYDIFDTIDIKSVFNSIMRSIDNWVSEDSEEEKTWTTLSHHVKHEKLLAILAYFIDYGTKNVVNREHRNNAILASRLYYKLLSVPGYKAYRVYHSQLFANSLACLSFPKAMCDSEDAFFNSKELAKEVNSVIRELSHFVIDLRDVMAPLQLNSRDMNFEDILSNLVDVTGGAIVNKLNVDKIELAKVTCVIYDMINIIICDTDGKGDPDAIKMVFKAILPKLVAASTDCKSANNLVRASYVTYSGLLLSKYGKAALPGYVVLLQHLCYTLEGLEKAEVRQARVSLVTGLMSLLPRKSYSEIVKWLLTLSTTAKVPHRHIAVEMLAKLLNNDPEEEKPIGSPNAENQATENAELNSDQNQNENTNVENPTNSENNGGETQMEAEATSFPRDVDESSQDSQDTIMDYPDITEEDINGLIRQRPHTVPYAAILHALYERVNDVSSTLRARALQLLTECLDSARPPMVKAIKDLNGEGAVSRLLAVGARCVCDERAAVRRAALPLVLRLLTAPQAPDPQPTDLAILVGACRDASVVVRGGAVSALCEVCARRPAPTVLAALLAGPLHQLSDPETKIQEQVMNMVKELLIDRLEKYDLNKEGDALPWNFLAAVTKYNMRRHLQKAFALLAKNTSCISPRLVDVASTHLGAAGDARDLHTLVLLTCAARHVHYGDVGFALQYYYALADDLSVRDPRLMPLVLELLTTWARWAGTAERAALRDHIVHRLAAASSDGCRLQSVTLAAHLDPHNLTWATELMQLSERRALSEADVEEWLRAADLSLVAPAPPQPALLHQFLGALACPPPGWSESVQGVCVAGAGRLCLRSREAAAATAPALANLLADTARPTCARVNALLALADICTRYTCIVEPLLECVSGCLAACAEPPLRRNAARALTRLLLAGYLRLRTPLYYRYCALLADEDDDVREPAEYYVTSCLTADKIYHHFVDCILNYNNGESDVNISFDARQLIYDVMLQRMSVVQRLNVQCRLAREVLEGAADAADERDGELPGPLHAALLDTITLLCGPRMKLPKKPQRDGDAAADIDDLQERITTNIVSHKMKRTVAEVVVPAVLRLYSRVAPRGGQVAAYLVRIANDLLVDYRQEIEELIENDEELVERVRHFQETIGHEPSFGNTRNLVTSSSAHEPETTPRAPRRRPVRNTRSAPRKRALRI